MANVNQTFDNEKKKVSREDVGKGLGEPELKHVLECELEVFGELYHVQIEEDCLDEQAYYGPIKEAEIDSLIQEATIDLLETFKEDEGKEDDFFLIEIEEDFLDEQPCYGPIEEAEIDLLETGKEDDFDHKEIVVDWLDDQPAYVPDQAPDIDMLFAELDFVI